MRGTSPDQRAYFSSSMMNSMMVQSPTRYDDVYYPRTDKRMISKLISIDCSIEGNAYAYEGNNFAKKTFQANAVEESIEQIIVNQE
jgi:hypothetical protein